MPYWRTPAPVAEVRLCSEAPPVSASRRCSNTPAPQASICTSSPEPAWSGIGSSGPRRRRLPSPRAVSRSSPLPCRSPRATSRAACSRRQVYQISSSAPFGPSESRAVVAAHFGDRVAPAVVDWLVASANGNPLALIELPRGLTPEQVNGQESLSATVPPATTVESGLNGMNDATRAHIAGWQPGPHAGDPQRRRGSSVTASRFGSANSDRLIISVFWDGARQAKALGLAST